MSYRFSLELQCASLFSPQISSQIKPAKFETFETETYFRQKNLSQSPKAKICRSGTISFFGFGNVFFQFQSETVFIPFLLWCNLQLSKVRSF